MFVSCQRSILRKDMIMRKIKLDVHTHTIASGHAYGTLNEMAKAAAEKGLDILGITEHAPGIPGTCDMIYFANMKVVPRKLYGVELLLGAEINILDYEGRLSFPDSHFKYLDVRIAGIHNICYKNGTKEENTRAVVNAIKDPRIDIISHPDDGRCPLDYKQVVEAAKEYRTLLEVNNNSLRLPARRKVKENILEFLELCAEYEQPVIADSDAHFMDDVANLDHASVLLDQSGFPEHLLMNYYPDQFKEFLRKNRELERKWRNSRH